VGLDVYVGSLRRYYTGDWETVMQQRAREAGLDSMVIRPFGEEEEIEPGVIKEMVPMWREALNETFADRLQGTRVDWDESEESPYFTDKPDWSGYAALILHAAYEEHPELEAPEEVPEDWQEDKAYAASQEDLASSRYSALLAPELWLPVDFGLLMEFKELRGQDVLIGPSPLLLHSLKILNARTFDGSAEDLARWSTGEVEAQTELEAYAQLGLGIFTILTEHAVSQRLPMKLDY
jgi:hypothetical protein